MGKGYRKKIPPSRYISPDDTDSLSDDERNNDNNNKKKAINSVNVQSIKGSYKRKSNKDLHVDTIDTQENNNNAAIESHITNKLPEWPSSIVNSKNENTCLVPTDGIIIFENSEYLLHISKKSTYNKIHVKQFHIFSSTC